MNNPQEVYLESQVLSANPQRLRLLLIEGALRFGRQALRQWEADQWDAASESLARCRDIVEELLQSIHAETSPLAKRVADLYLFLFQSLAESQIRRDQQPLTDVLGILESERETWRQVCEQEVDNTPSEVPTPIPALLQTDYSELTETSGFSADA